MLSAHSVRGFVLAVSWVAVSTTAHAQAPADAPVPSPIGILKEAAKDFAGLASIDTLRVLAIGGASAGAVHPADGHVNQQLHGSDYRFLSPGRIVGNAAIQGGGAVATYVWGRASGTHSQVAAIGQELIRAQIVTQTSTFAIKAAVRRTRPDASNQLSFPSGHASTTFATATIIDGHFGWRVATPTYLVATYVAVSRLHENRHNASDVVFGAALGIAAGRVTLRREKSRLLIQPVAMAGGAGIVMLW
jgi:hypothetical protein